MKFISFQLLAEKKGCTEVSRLYPGVYMHSRYCCGTTQFLTGEIRVYAVEILHWFF